MEVILLERIGRLGQMGDVVRVKDGFARNFLLPQGKALRATKANMDRFETERVQLEAKNLELKNEAQAVADKIEGKDFITIRQAGDTGQLYGSVSTRDIAEIITEGGFTIERRQVLLDRPIKVLGLHPVRLSLHPEVESSVTINVARTEDEAKRQAAGEDVTAIRDEEDDKAPIDAEDVFDDEEHARAAEAALEENEETENADDAESAAAERDDSADGADDKE